MLIKSQFIDDAKCIKCDETAIRQFTWSIGTKFCLCPRHQFEAIETEKAFNVFDDDIFEEQKNKEATEKFNRRVIRCGLPHGKKPRRRPRRSKKTK